MKQWPPRRVARAAQQIGSEVQARVIEKYTLGGPVPLMALPLYHSSDPEGYSSMITPYAGPSLTQLRNGPWSKLSSDALVVKCRRLAACGATTLTLLEDVRAEFGGRKLHRDIKPDNYCYDENTDLFLLVDFGGLCSANKRDWFSMQDFRYLDAHLAALDVRGHPAVFSLEGQRNNTHPSMDLYMLALTVMYLYLGTLPDPINVVLYGQQNTAKYVAAVREFSWEKCEELKSMPADMREWLLWLLQKHPSKRPQSANEALDHRWLAKEAEVVDDVVEDAVKDWENLHAAIAEALYPTKDRSCSSSVEAGACCSSEGGRLQQLGQVESTSEQHDSRNVSIEDQPCSRSSVDAGVCCNSSSTSLEKDVAAQVSSSPCISSEGGCLQQLEHIESTCEQHDSRNVSLIPAGVSIEKEPYDSSSNSSSHGSSNDSPIDVTRCSAPYEQQPNTAAVAESSGGSRSKNMLATSVQADTDDSNSY